MNGLASIDILVIFNGLTVLMLAMLFTGQIILPKIESRPSLVSAWHLIFRFCCGILFWFVATALTVGLLRDYFFQEQNTWLLSGSPISIGSMIFWLIPVVWVLAGRHEAAIGTDGKLVTVDQRLDFIFSGFARVILFALLGVVCVVGLIVVVLGGEMLDQAISKLSVQHAIIVGAIIIALAAGSRK